MKTKAENPWAAREGERGAALITALLVSMLLLAAGGALIATTSMTATNAVDSTAEAQAYYAAEAGLQSTLSVLRRNVPSNPSGTAATFRTVVCGAANTGCVNSGNLSLWLTGDATVSADPPMSFSVVVHDDDYALGAALPDAPYEPRRLVITSTGRGPKGARKLLEMKVDAYPFDFNTHAAVTIRSNDSDMIGMSTFSVGSSAPHSWTGNDLAGLKPALPAFTVTNTMDYDAGDGFGPLTVQGKGEAAVGADSGNISGSAPLAKLSPSSLESWLQTADNARAFLNAMRQKAASIGRLNPSDIGTEANPKFTFLDGDLDLSGSTTGAGLMIVVGNVTQSGSSSFKGIVMALGNGHISRNGTPNALGAVVMANFQHTLNSNGLYTGTGGFGSPFLDSAGGGNSTVGYDSSWVKKALDTGGARALGMVEK